MINQEQNVIDYLNELHVDGTIMGNTINNPVDSSSGRVKSEYQKCYVSIFKYNFIFRYESHIS